MGILLEISLLGSIKAEITRDKQNYEKLGMGPWGKCSCVGRVTPDIYFFERSVTIGLLEETNKFHCNFQNVSEISSKTSGGVSFFTTPRGSEG